MRRMNAIREAMLTFVVSFPLAWAIGEAVVFLST